MNVVILIGKVQEKSFEDGKATIKLSIQNPFKNEQGEYDFTIVKCELYGALADVIAQQIKRYDLISVRGRLGENNAVIVEKMQYLGQAV